MKDERMRDDQASECGDTESRGNKKTREAKRMEKQRHSREHL